jgi:predicted NAD/FAD-dependent oxidoreductase
MDLEAQGVVRQWTGPVGEIKDKTFSPLPTNEPIDVADEPKLFVGVGGMDTLSKGLAKTLKCEIDCWVAKVLRLENGKWRLFRFANMC